MRRVSDMVARISGASAAQTTPIDQVNRTVTALDDLSEKNATLAAEVSAASAELRDKAGERRELMSFFSLGEGMKRRH